MSTTTAPGKAVAQKGLADYRAALGRTTKAPDVRVRITGPNATTLAEAAEERGLSVTQLVHKLIEELAR